jgi:hypothetical protein
MDINYFDLSGGINQASTKTELGLNPKKIYWADAQNIEILDNKGIIRQNGNALFLELPSQEKITCMGDMEADGVEKLVITTVSGKIYIYSSIENKLTLLDKTLTGKKVIIVKFLRGVIISTESDGLFYIKNNSNFDIVECEVNDLAGDTLYPDCITIYKGRVWCAKDSTIYYSALGSYSDFTTEDDAGYINDFHTDTDDITAMCTYKDYLAVYKKERVYLLSGSSPDDFAISLFADKGAYAKGTPVNVDNKQFFLSNGVYALEQVGELNQIRLGSEISLNIVDEFNNFDTTRIDESFVLHYSNKHQMWFFFPYAADDYFHTIWINDYLNHAWFKRVVPQNIICACMFNNKILTADDEGKVYQEDSGTSFNGEGISFMWKSPFLSLGNVLHRKLIDEFYFVLDDVYDNKFRLDLYKDYDSEYSEDFENISSKIYNHLIWADENSPEDKQYCWNDGNSDIPIWSISVSSMEKAEICGSNFSVQLCITGEDLSDNCAIIGLQFREIYNDD